MSRREVARAMPLGRTDQLTEGGTGVQRIAPVLRALVLELDLESSTSALRMRGIFPSGVAGGWKVRWVVDRFEDLGLVRLCVFGQAALAAERFAWSKQPFEVRVPLPRVVNLQVPYDLLISTLRGRALARVPWAPLA